MREIAVDRNQWRAVCGSRTSRATEETPTPHDKTSELSFDTALYPHEYKKLTQKLQMSKQNEQIE
jgi:hypothetical protein